MSLCVRCYHPFDFICVELKRHRPRCPRWYSGRHRRCVGFSPSHVYFVIAAYDPERVDVGLRDAVPHRTIR